MREKHLLTWLRPYKGLPQHPEATPFGRAAITLAHEGIRLFLAATSTSWTRYVTHQLTDLGGLSSTAPLHAHLPARLLVWGGGFHYVLDAPRALADLSARRRCAI